MTRKRGVGRQDGQTLYALTEDKLSKPRSPVRPCKGHQDPDMSIWLLEQTMNQPRAEIACEAMTYDGISTRTRIEMLRCLGSVKASSLNSTALVFELQKNRRQVN